MSSGLRQVSLPGSPRCRQDMNPERAGLFPGSPSPSVESPGIKSGLEVAGLLTFSPRDTSVSLALHTYQRTGSLRQPCPSLWPHTFFLWLTCLSCIHLQTFALLVPAFPPDCNEPGSSWPTAGCPGLEQCPETVAAPQLCGTRGPGVLPRGGGT